MKKTFGISIFLMCCVGFFLLTGCAAHEGSSQLTKKDPTPGEAVMNQH